MKKSLKIILPLLALVIVLGVGWLIYRHFSSPSIVPQHTGETVQEQQQDNQKKAATINASKNPDQGSYTPPSNNGNIELSPRQTSASQVVLTTKLIGYSDGNCSLVITNGSKSVTLNAQVIYQPEFSTCAGFTQDISSLGTGTWNFNLSITSGGVTTTNTATLGVK